jgi:hypothetical protein
MSWHHVTMGVRLKNNPSPLPNESERKTFWERLVEDDSEPKDPP